MKNKVCCWILIGIGVFFLLMFIGTGLLIATSLRGGSQAAIVKEHTYLTLDLSGIVADYHSGPQIERFLHSQPATLVEIKRALEKAAGDDRIAGVVLRPMGIRGFAQIRETKKAQVGRVLPVLIEGHGDGLSVGRTYRDAPEIDGLVLVPGELPLGELVPVRIDGAMTYDLTGVPDMGEKPQITQISQIIQPSIAFSV